MDEKIFVLIGVAIVLIALGLMLLPFLAGLVGMVG
jgi:hypothetical protein